jgi:hypothetical protein
MSSFRIVPVAVAVLIWAFEALDSVTVNPSSDSTVVSPSTLTVIVLLVSPGLNVSVPLGSVPPTKSTPLAGFDPLPVTDQLTVVEPVVNPDRVTVNVNGVAPAMPLRFHCVQRRNRQCDVIVQNRARRGGGADLGA